MALHLPTPLSYVMKFLCRRRQISAVVLTVAAMCPGITQAKALSIVTDIPATHSLVAQVMGNLGEPVLLLSGGASPHDYSLKPSEATLLSSSDAIFWISRDLTPWLPRALQSLAPDTQSLELIKFPDTRTLTFRSTTEFDKHSTDTDKTDDNTHSHDHKIDGIDPHAWLDPVNARIWLMHIANVLSALDEDNQATYLANAQAADAKLQSLTNQLSTSLSSLHQKPFLVFHDSYQYFESRFNIHAIGAISLGDGSRPSIKQISALREQLAEHNDTCVFSEPQFNRRLIKSVTQGMSISNGQLDPVGTLIEPGPGLYEQLLTRLSDSLTTCLKAVN